MSIRALISLSVYIARPLLGGALSTFRYKPSAFECPKCISHKSRAANSLGQARRFEHKFHYRGTATKPSSFRAPPALSKPILRLVASIRGVAPISPCVGILLELLLE